MTESDLPKIKFRMVSHLSMSFEHVASYVSVENNPMIGMCVHTPIRDDGSFGKAITHYQLNGKVYKSKKKFLEAVTTFEQEQKNEKQ